MILLETIAHAMYIVMLFLLIALMLEAIKLAICIRVLLPRLVSAVRIYLLARSAREKTEMEMEYHK